MLALTLGEPVLVSQAPADVQHWGPWQFPYIEWLPDGNLHIGYNTEADAFSAYGLPCGHAVSEDRGMTWHEVRRLEGIYEWPSWETGGVLLPNGDHLRSVVLRSRRVEELNLPEPLERHTVWAENITIYCAAHLPPELGGWHMARLKAGQCEWVEEVAQVNIPGQVRGAMGGYLGLPWIHRLRLATDGSIWGLNHDTHLVNNEYQRYLHVLCLRSTDQGHTWNVLSEIPYQPDQAADPFWEQRDGFTEPDVAFLRDGSALCLMRTDDGSGPGPLYWARSTDSGQTWSRPQVFDDFGVWPHLLTLKNSITLAAYGRPGLYVRATADPSGREWGARVMVVTPGERLKDTCSYCDLIALNDHTALMAYSDFNVPDQQGRRCKTILARTVSVSSEK